MFLSNNYISFIFNLSYHLEWADVTVVSWVPNRNTVTMWLKVSIFQLPNMQEYMILQGNILSACMIGCVHVLAQA